MNATQKRWYVERTAVGNRLDFSLWEVKIISVSIFFGILREKQSYSLLISRYGERKETSDFIIPHSQNYLQYTYRTYYTASIHLPIYQSLRPLNDTIYLLTKIACSAATRVYATLISLLARAAKSAARQPSNKPASDCRRVRGTGTGRNIFDRKY